jgi:hypothetical protein
MSVCDLPLSGRALPLTRCPFGIHCAPVHKSINALRECLSDRGLDIIWSHSCIS